MALYGIWKLFPKTNQCPKCPYWFMALPIFIIIMFLMTLHKGAVFLRCDFNWEFRKFQTYIIMWVFPSNLNVLTSDYGKEKSLIFVLANRNNFRNPFWPKAVTFYFSLMLVSVSLYSLCKYLVTKNIKKQKINNKIHKKYRFWFELFLLDPSLNIFLHYLQWIIFTWLGYMHIVI